MPRIGLIIKCWRRAYHLNEVKHYGSIDKVKDQIIIKLTKMYDIHKTVDYILSPSHTNLGIFIFMLKFNSKGNNNICWRSTMVIHWNEELATGNKEIDNQNKEMFRRFNNFQSARKQGKGLDELSNLLTFLDEYIRSHFELEEQLQIDYDFPGYLKHKEEHEGFIRNLRTLEEQLNIQGTNSTLLIQINMALVTWLIRHFNWMDKDLAKFLHTAMPKQQSLQRYRQLNLNY
jgi:hemerythrin